MSSRNPRHAPKRSAAPIYRGPQAASVTPATHSVSTPFHAPNAALLIDFDNVTMGIRSDLGNELRNLLGSDIIKGKVAVQRAYADWRRYPQYIVPLAESSIDMIMAPAYGSSKKNATDIRLAVDAMELVFTRPEIGTYILLSGDSDFASLVTKLKEYGKYVIGVGIRESSSDLLVMNCDEYYSYNTLAGLVKSSEEETVKWDPWELVFEAITRMKKGGDVMRSDRLKQVMQEIDSTFDERNLGISKFSKFCLEAAQRGLLSVSRLENGQLEVDLPSTPALASPEKRGATAGTRALVAPEPEREDEAANGGRSRRGRRGGRGRGAARERGRDETAPAESAVPVAAEPRESQPRRVTPEPVPLRDADRPPGAAPAERSEEIGLSGERLTRDEAFDLVRSAVEALTKGPDESVLASEVRASASMILGRDSESLSERNFQRILRDAHDANAIDLRRRGDDFEVSRAAAVPSVADQLARAAEATAPAARPSNIASAPPRRGMGPRGGGPVGRRGGIGRPATPPPDLLSVGVVDFDAVAPDAVSEIAPEVPAASPPSEPVADAGREPRERRSRGRKRAPRGGVVSEAAPGAPAAPAAPADDGAPSEPPVKSRRPRPRKAAAKGSGE